MVSNEPQAAQRLNESNIVMSQRDCTVIETEDKPLGIPENQTQPKQQSFSAKRSESRQLSGKGKGLAKIPSSLQS